jgi:hypothetical protein
MYSVSLCGGGGPSAAGTLQGMAGVISAPRIVFTFANVVLVGVFRWPPCHIVNSTPDAISKRVNPLRYGGGLFGPPLFQRPNSQKNLKSQKIKKNVYPSIYVSSLYVVLRFLSKPSNLHAK